LYQNAANKNIKSRNNFLTGFLKEVLKNRSLYSMILPAAILLILFCYLPLMGLIIAFKDYKFDGGILGSNWAKPIFGNFIFLFGSGDAFRALKNTVLLNGCFIVVGTIFQVGLALMLNEISNKLFKKITQSFTFLPYFISWIVVGVFAYNLFSYDTGAINTITGYFGIEKTDWYSNAGIWPILMIFFSQWKSAGYGAVVYLATIAGIDGSYFEAAQIDGATKLQQIRYISLPMLRPTIIILTLLAIGKIMNADFGMFYALVGDAAQLYPTTDVIDTFVYRNLRLIGDIGMASAAGFAQSVLSFVLVIASNYFVKKYDQDAALF
jgi:putative aldouronate transport system permease protein